MAAELKTAPRFRTQYDGWILALLLGPWLGAGVLLATTLQGRDRWAWVPFLVITAFVLWCAATDYSFGETDLQIRAGPFRWRVPLRDVVRVTATRDPLSGPAWSLDRLAIEYRGGNGTTRKILVSPSERPEFLKELRRRCPGAALPGT